jgi:hydroxyacid-oxoacid transhydrogenase
MARPASRDAAPAGNPPMTHETAFTMDTSSIKYGPGVTREIGADVRAWGARRVMVVTDPGLRHGESVRVGLDALRAEGIDAVVFDGVRVEPTDASFAEAIAFAADGRFDGYVAIGGGSVIDTAKAANLYATYPAPFLTYVNPPVGEGQPVPGRLKPLVAVPTTAGTGSETTGVAIFDFQAMHAKTGIAHRALRPVLGIVDPDNTRTLPRLVAACSGLDVLCHALESYTALPYSRRAAPSHPTLRTTYQGANPISDVWAARAIELVAQHIVRAIEDPSDDEARSQMLLASTFAGIGFGNAGVHLPHGMSYPVSGMVRSFVAEGYPADRPMIPHGMSVILNAP